jgi:hypothetical protein|tara:strand:+ start:561 stop:752 length:192 start_codon:yes stop_codon:yes gene_type:complete
MTINKYNFTDHSEIPGHIQIYLLSVAEAVHIEELVIDDINDFMNGLETWETEQIFEESSRHIH